MIRVEVEDSFVEMILKEIGDVLQPTTLKFTWDLISDGLVSTYQMNHGITGYELIHIEEYLV